MSSLLIKKKEYRIKANLFYSSRVGTIFVEFFIGLIDF